MGRWTFLDLALKVIEEEKRPLTPREIWEVAKSEGYEKRVESLSKTPWKSIATQIYVNIRDRQDSPFIKIDSRPNRFYLRALG